MRLRLTRRFLVVNGAALLAGAVVGLAAVGFRYLINLIENLSFRGTWHATPREDNLLLSSPWGVAVILVPAAGGLLVGLMRIAWPASRQRGVAEVMAAVQARGGALRARSSWGHALVSAITVGMGGSTGREGPIAYIGAAVGSSVGRRFGFTPRDVKVLLGAGFAAGIAATFNAPMGGVLLALEIIVPEFSAHAFIPLVGATVVGTSVAHGFLGSQATFLVPDFVYHGPRELALYLFLGVLCGLGGFGFIRLMGASQRFWARLALPDWTKPMLGGLVVGLIGFLLFQEFGAYHVFGTGYGTLSALLAGNPAVLAVGVLLALAFLKPLATVTTIGSGGGGGVFSASLVIGGTYGGLIGLLFAGLFPSAAIEPTAFALVGMGAFYAATARATLTAIVILAELVDDYTILLPLMLAAVAADAVCISLSKESIYTIRLAEAGILYDHDKVSSPLDFLQVKDVMTTNVDSLPNTKSAQDAYATVLAGGHTGYPVVDAEGKLAGICTRRDLGKLVGEGKGNEPLSAVVSGMCITAFPDELLFRARDRIFQQDIGRLVVVDPADRRRILGILTRSDLLRAEAERDVEHQDFFEEAKL